MMEEELFGNGRLLRIGLLILKSFFPSETYEREIPRLDVKRPGIERTLEDCDDKTELPKQEMIPTYKEFERWFDSDYKDKKTLDKLRFLHRNYKTGLEQLSDEQVGEIKELQKKLNKGMGFLDPIVKGNLQNKYPFLRENGRVNEYTIDDAFIIYLGFEAKKRYDKELEERDDRIQGSYDDEDFFDEFDNPSKIESYKPKKVKKGKPLKRVYKKEEIFPSNQEFRDYFSGSSEARLEVRVKLNRLHENPHQGLSYLSEEEIKKVMIFYNALKEKRGCQDNLAIRDYNARYPFVNTKNPELKDALVIYIHEKNLQTSSNDE